MRAGLQTVQQAWAAPASVRTTALNPALRYLLVRHQDREALLVWVGDEPGPLGSASVWVGADGVVLRTVHGRLVGVAEPTRNWRVVGQTPPSPTSALAQGSPTSVTQTIDMQPGHRLGLRVPLLRTALSSAPSTTLLIGSAAEWRWEEEHMPGTTLPPSWVAQDAHGEVVYGQRCLAVDWCLSWQAWPTAVQATP